MSDQADEAGVEVEEAPEPKSIHTYFPDLPTPGITDCSVEVRINLPERPRPAGLYFAAIQVNFDSHDEWAHGGLQLASGTKKVNWGGGADRRYGYTADGREMRILTDAAWTDGRWYRYTVRRDEQGPDGYYPWHFTVQPAQAAPLPRETLDVSDVGSLPTLSRTIAGIVVWTETGWDVHCRDDPVTVEWRDPRYGSGGHADRVPPRAVAGYNGTCEAAHSTNQELLTDDPYHWIQQTNARRTVSAGAALWPRH